VLVVDIDECLPGGIAESCNAESGGLCQGHLTDERFSCSCQDGYQLNADGTSCISEYQLVCIIIIIIIRFVKRQNVKRLPWR